MKPRSESENGRLAAASREAVNKLLDRSNARGSRGKKNRDDSAQNCDSAKVSFPLVSIHYEEHHCCGFHLVY